MSRYRELHRLNDTEWRVQLWPGAELEDGTDTLTLALADAFLRVDIDIDSIDYEINQINNAKGGQESVLTWSMLGRTRQELIVKGEGVEPTVIDELDVVAIPANGNTVNMTAPVSGFGIRTAKLRLFVDKEHLEVLRQRLEQGVCASLQAIIRFELAHHAGAAAYLIEDGHDYEGSLESVQASVRVAPPARANGGPAIAPNDVLPGPAAASLDAPVAEYGSGGYATALAGTELDHAIGQLNQSVEGLKLHFRIAILAVCAMVLAILLV